MPGPHRDSSVIDRLQRLGGDTLATRVIDFFLTSTPERIGALQAECRQNDLAGVERIAHALRSSAGNVGAREMLDLVTRVEALARQGEERGIAGLVDDIEAAFERVRPELAHQKQELEP